MRVKVLILATALTGAIACARVSEEPAAQSGPAELKRIADAYLEAVTARDPLVVYFSLTDVMTPDHAGLTDISPEGIAAFNQTEDALLAALRNVDPQSPTSRGDWVTYRALKETMEADVALRQCRREWWSVSHLNGWQAGLGTIAQLQPVASEEEREAALARWSKLPAFIAQDRANLERGLSEGYSAPKSVVVRVVAQLDAVIAAPLEANPYFGFVARAGDAPEFEARARGLFEEQVTPAIAAFRDFLRDEYLPAARAALAITALPNGAACYEAMLRSYHSAEIGGQRTYERGRAQVEANTNGAIARAETMLGTTDWEAIQQRVNEDPANRFASEEELIAFTRALVPAAKARTEKYFLRLPGQDLVVEPYPDYLRGSGQPSRYEPNPDASASATYRISADDWAELTRGRAEIVAVHEGWPGHHMQIATALGLEGLHPVTRLASSTAYIEGWARYAEALAEEAGIYESGYGEITRRMWPARGMVVDPGLHLYGWTEEEAIAFLKDSGRFTDVTARDMLDRIAVIPGQLTAYDTGGLEIFALRREAEGRLGEAFDIREFHQRILENGALPLGAMRDHLEAWIEKAEAGGAE